MMSCPIYERLGLELGLTDFVYDKDVHSVPGVVFLGVTNRCNLSCPYCFVAQGQSDMTMETAENAIQLAFKNHEKNHAEGKPLIVFFGGEPLIRFNDLIKPIVEKYVGKANFTITTNGTLLDEDTVDFLYQYNVAPLLSFDGVPVIQNTQRPGKGFNSFDAVLKNVPYLLVRFPDTTARATLTRLTIPHFLESFKMFEELGFKNVTFGLNSFEEWTIEDFKEMQDQFTKCGEYIWERLNTPTNYPVPRLISLVNAYSMYKANVEGTAFFDNNVERCGMGTTTFSVCPWGDIVPCQEKLTNPTWVIGNVNEGGIDPEKHKAFLEWYWNNINKMECDKPAWSADVCRMCIQSICPSRLEDLNFTRHTSDCFYWHAVFSTAMRFYFLVDGTIRPEIRRYFTPEVG